MNTRSTTNTTLPLGSINAENDLHLTAIHEAGHAVTYWRMGREIVSVTIRGTAAHRGLTQPPSVMIDDISRDQVLVAGPVAQAMATLAVAEPDEWDTAEQVWDHHLAGALMGGGQDDVDRFLADPSNGSATFDIWATVLRIQLTELWTPLIALAEALIEHETLTGREAFAVLDGALPADHYILRR